MRARETIEAALLAAIAAQPFDPGLSVVELQQVVVGREGIGVGTFRDVLHFFHTCQGLDERMRLDSYSMMGTAATLPQMNLPNEVRPAAALNTLGTMFDELENEEGRDACVELHVIHARCATIQAEKIDHALGFVVRWGRVERKDDSYCRHGRSWPKYNTDTLTVARDQLPIGTLAAELLPAVRDVFALRANTHVASEPPTARFGRFLTKQGWTGFAGWWTSTLCEMNSLSDERHPSAICVLCGALLEAALVAISMPAKDAGEWKRDFLKSSPENWKLGQLIDQAETAKTCRPEQRALAD
ncbi:MAG: hypothetical protein FWD73_15230 [Polyangiaceae bacterium]|nr:hypothetical protein [Polyangiaceae bacterium]